ncbi:DNA repair protein RecO [Candidatus Uabimicrobium sp. HlEnr_7]|uniref:DNA repair protein RecO n=1 Tax=Candidatus Uabimicrobium helgolandensis TaxID=3095367 RepID=UPI0035587597
MIIKEDAIVLKSINYSNSSQIMSLYTKDHGKISMLAKGSRNKSAKQFAGTFEPTLHVEVVYREKDANVLAIVREFEIVDYFYGVRSSLKYMYNAFYLVDFVNECTVSHDPNQGLFQLLHTSLKYLSMGASAEKIRFFFQIKSFILLGIMPILTECCLCSKVLIGSYVFFIPKESGIICRKCKESNEDAFLQISMQALRTLKNLEVVSWAGLKKVNLSVRIVNELNMFFRFYLQSFLYKDLRTFKLIGSD